jgi:L-ascorbate 6-phosphate lactonase
MSLMKEIRNYRVPADSIGIWWFGQNGFVFKTPEGTLACIDMYLTDSCATLIPDMNFNPRVPILLKPDKVEVDVFACTTIIRTTPVRRRSGICATKTRCSLSDHT